MVRFAYTQTIEGIKFPIVPTNVAKDTFMLIRDVVCEVDRIVDRRIAVDGAFQLTQARTECHVNP